VNGGENHFILYDTRAAVFEALQNPKDALKDAKATIKLAPRRWQGYARAARLFMKTHKFDAALRMADLALIHIKPEDTKRREKLSKLKIEIIDYQEVTVEHERKMANHMLKLPVEIYNEVFQYVLGEGYAQIITLLHICSHWRQVVWNSPGLWHTLVLSKRRADKKAELWLERSKGHIRELHVLSDYTSKELPGRPSFLRRVDWSGIRGCRILSPDIRRFIEPHTMLQDIEGLELDAFEGEVFNLPSFTRMKSLSLLRARLHLKQLLHPFPFLSSLSLQHCNLRYREANSNDCAIYDFFHLNPQIESLCFRGFVLQGFWERQIPLSPSDIDDPPNLENLTTLDIAFSTWATSILLFHIPSLRTLRLEGIGNHVQHHIQHYLSTSPRNLTELSLFRMTLNAPLILDLLRSAPALEVLELVGMFKASDAVISTLSQTNSTSSEESQLPCVCPHLRHLDVSDCPDVTTSAVYSLVKQRLTLSTPAVDNGDGTEGESTPSQAQVNRLEVLKMDGCSLVEVEWIPWFKQRVSSVSCDFTLAGKKKAKGIARRL
jgi:hypothetical protein